MKKRTNIATVLFIIGILAAGTANAFARQIIIDFGADAAAPAVLPFFSTVMFCLNLALYVFLLLFWVRSVQQRLLPGRERGYMIAAALCAIAMLMLRSIKYRMIDGQSVVLLRYAWYLYYVPMTLMPALFLMMCIRVDRRGKGRFDERLLLIPAAVIILLFLTNDLHFLAFRPTKGLFIMNGGDDTYTNGPLIYVYYAFCAVTVLIGMICLTRANSRSRRFKAIALPFIFLLGILGLTMLNKALSLVQKPSMFMMPEIIAFGMIGVFESGIRNRLIPYNENYGGFFGQMQFPAVIADSRLHIVHRSAQRITASPEQLRAAINAPVYSDEAIKLSAVGITAGCAFYTEDERELHRLNERLKEANELIAGENDLIRAENELKAKQAQVDSRNLVYARIAEKMLPYHRRALAMIDSIDKDDPDFEEKIARLNLLNVYIKRGSNLLLVEEGKKYISVNELKLAIEEFSRYLSYCGITANSTVTGDTIGRDEALSLFTAIYEVSATLCDDTTMLSIVIDGIRLRMTADGAADREPPEYIAVRESGGLYFYSFSAGEGGAV